MSYEKLVSMIPKKYLQHSKVKEELSIIKNGKLDKKYFAFITQSKKLGRKLNNRCNSIVGYLLGFANKPTGKLVLENYQAPPD